MKVRMSRVIVCLMAAMLFCAQTVSSEAKKTAAQPKKGEVALTVTDVNSLLAGFTGTELDPFVETPLFFMKVDMPAYDSFFFESAKLNGATVISKNLTLKTNETFKKWAVAAAGNEAFKADVKTVIGDAAPESMTYDNAVSIMKILKAKKAFSDAQKSYMNTAVINLGLASKALVDATKAGAGLPDQGKQLAGTVKADFTGAKALKVPSVTSGLSASTSNVAEALKNSPSILSEMTSLLDVLGSLVI